MKLTLTTMAGNTRTIHLMSEADVYDFIDIFKATLLPSQRVKVTCDILSLDGYLQGEKIQNTVDFQNSEICVLTIFFVFFLTYHVSYI